ncbi:hypothetical protein [Hydrogenobacter thermophilus]|uniref:hypothetical protein n=1 Tax=Hydrogenobacter thermophilus TaxID=940 RepID=UPI0030F7AEC3
MRIAFVCAEESKRALLVLKAIRKYSDLSVWTPKGSNLWLYHLCDLPLVEFSAKEPYVSCLSSFDAVLYFLTSDSFNLLSGLVCVPGIFLIVDDIPLPQFSSYQESFLHFFFEEDPINRALLIMSQVPPSSNLLPPYKPINLSSPIEELSKDIFEGIRLAHAFVPFYKFMTELKDSFLKDVNRELLKGEFLENLLKELNTFYNVYKLSVDSLSQ